MNANESGKVVTFESAGEQYVASDWSLHSDDRSGTRVGFSVDLRIANMNPTGASLASLLPDLKIENLKLYVSKTSYWYLPDVIIERKTINSQSESGRFICGPQGEFFGPT